MKICGPFYVSILGRRPCLWCLATKDETQLSIESRGQNQSRSLANLASDYEKFVSDGSDLKRAKFFNNVISAPIFDIELDHVSQL